MITIGIMGGGQLARMLALAGLPLGLRFVFLDPAPDACAAHLGRHLCGDYDDPVLLRQLAQAADVVTYEFENVPEESIRWLASQVPVFPDANALMTARDRLLEKTLFRELDIPTANFAAVNTHDDLLRAVGDLGLPAILKTRTLGYDGKGQCLLRNLTDIELAWNSLGGSPLILESFVPYRREVSLVAVRSRYGDTAFYPLAENLHQNGVLRVSRSRPGDALQQPAQNHLCRLFERLNYVGVLAVEFFEKDGQLIANEMAPRVHNSGHWTIEGAITSQFENHLRAILALPLGSATTVGHSAMINFIGEIPEQPRMLGLPGTHLHLYDKKPLPGRKLGHATLCANNPKDLETSLGRLLDMTCRGATATPSRHRLQAF